MPENKRNLLEKRARQIWQHVYKPESKQTKTVKSLLFNHSAIFDTLSSDKPHEHSLVLRKKTYLEIKIQEKAEESTV